MMKIVKKLFAVGYSTVSLIFVLCAIALIVFALFELWKGINPINGAPLWGRFNAVLESIGLLTIAVAALELGQTILEEEVLREAHPSGPTRARRFLSRFMIVIVVALAIEALVAAFQFSHDNPDRLAQASMIAVAAAVLLAAWGVFVKLNTSAEKLEPEAMEKAKMEDHKME
jgi:hypothetical protein